MTKRWVRHRQLRAVLLIVLTVTGCSIDSLLKSEEVPPEVTDPAITETPAGSIAAYHGTIVQFRRVFGSNTAADFLSLSGRLSDELLRRTTAGNPADPVDERKLPISGSEDAVLYSDLQKLRGQAAQAIGLLRRYVPQEPGLASHTYALQAYAEIFLAEFFCSGVPLSTLDFGGDFTYQSGSTTGQVFQHAAALFDTARALAGDSTRFEHLARVGRGRALLAMGDYAGAAAEVAAVPDDYSYAVSYTATPGALGFNFARGSATFWAFSVADEEGLNGLDYRSSGDPRTQVTEGTRDGITIYHPDKYALNGSSPIVLASGVEARLIEAEAALRANQDADAWLAKLNALRTDGTQDAGGVYNPGTGGVAGLAPLVDPGTPNERVDLLFRERAFWLFLTGHRQGELRRLIRQYGRNPEQIYPVGAYSPPTDSDFLLGAQYGSDITAPVPPQEQILNPRYHGCASRGA